jgi:ABC-type amino acid transport substrate-binding protein
MKKTGLSSIGIVSLGIASLLLSSCGSGVDNSKIVIGLECNYAPFNWTEKAENSFTLPISNHAGQFADGYDIQIAKKMSEDLKKDVVVVQLEWGTLIPDLQAGTINAIIAGMTDTEEREQSIDFTDEYYRSELVLVTKKETADKYTSALSEADFSTLIKGKYLVSQSSTVTDDIIETFATKYGCVHNTPVSSFALAAQDVTSGSAFAMTAELPVANSIVASNSALGIVHMDQAILGETQAELGVSIGIKKGNTELKDALNSSLAKITKTQRDDLMSAAVIRSSAL